MARSRPKPMAPEWDDGFTRMVGVSALAHAVAIGLLVVAGAHLPERPLPLVAYTVEIADPRALGGRLPPGSLDRPLAPASSGGGGERDGGSAKAPADPPSPPAVAPPKVAEPVVEVPKPKPTPPTPKPVDPPKPKANEPVVKLPDAKKPPEPKLDPKPVPKPKVEPTPPEPAKPTEAKPAPTKADAKVEPKSGPTTAGKPVPAAKPATATDPAADDYAAAAERWQKKVATGNGQGAGGGAAAGTGTGGAAGGGLGGASTGSGPIGLGGPGGGGGQLVGLEFIAYAKRIEQAVKQAWVYPGAPPGLVVYVNLSVGADGAVIAAKVEKSSGNAAFDGSVLRAVQRASPFPPPPARYADQFKDVVIDFNSNEAGGGTG